MLLFSEVRARFYPSHFPPSAEPRGAQTHGDTGLVSGGGSLVSCRTLIYSHVDVCVYIAYNIYSIYINIHVYTHPSIDRIKANLYSIQIHNSWTIHFLGSHSGRVLPYVSYCCVNNWSSCHQRMMLDPKFSPLKHPHSLDLFGWSKLGPLSIPFIQITLW